MDTLQSKLIESDEKKQYQIRQMEDQQDYFIFVSYILLKNWRPLISGSTLKVLNMDINCVQMSYQTNCRSRYPR
jgi:hypothetical protein